MNDRALDLGPARHESPTDQRQILCLSGGGYRGLYTALVLEALDQRAGRRLADVFDVLAGTDRRATDSAATRPAPRAPATPSNGAPMTAHIRIDPVDDGHTVVLTPPQPLHPPARTAGSSPSPAKAAPRPSST